MNISSRLNRVISTLLVVIIFLTQTITFEITHGEEEFLHYSIAAILVDADIYNDTSKYQGLKDKYEDLDAETLSERVERYAVDVQNTLEYTKSLIIKVNKNEKTKNIALALEKLYFDGDSTRDESNSLSGVVLVGEIPLPIVYKDGNSYVSLFPYTDFKDKAFIYNEKSSRFEKNNTEADPQPEVWHGVIRPPVKETEGNELLATFFDKNHLYHIGEEDFTSASDKLFFSDTNSEEASLIDFGFSGYKKYLENWEKLAYQRFTKKNVTDLTSEADKAFEETDKLYFLGIDNDGDGLIDEDTTYDNDADLDEKLDEDPEGDNNADSCPGLCGYDDDADSIDSDSDNYPDGYEKEIGSLRFSTNIPTDPRNPKSRPLNYNSSPPRPRISPPPDENMWIDEDPSRDDPRCFDSSGVFHPEWDDDEDSFCDEDGPDDNDNDNDGEIDEDPGKTEVFSGMEETFSGLPDIQSQEIATKFFRRYYELFSKYLGDVNDFVNYTGRWNPNYEDADKKAKSDLDTIVSLISIKDEYTMNYLNRVNRIVEWELDHKKIIPDLQSEIPLNTETVFEIVAEVRNFSGERVLAPFKTSFINNSKIGGKFYVNGKRVENVDTVRECLLYRGSENEDSQAVKGLRVLNAFQDQKRNDGGCSNRNILYPESCFPERSEVPVFDIIGTTLAEEGALIDYRGCYDFKDEESFKKHLKAVDEYSKAVESAETEEDRAAIPVPYYVYPSFDEVNLVNTIGMEDIVPATFTFGEFLDEAGIARDKATVIDNVWMMGETRYEIEDASSQWIGKVKINIKREKEKDIPSYFTHKDPLSDVISAQNEAGFSSYMPIDDPRHATFRDKNGKYSKIDYINSFDLSSVQEFEEALALKEQEVELYPGGENYAGGLTSLLGRKISRAKLKDAIAWKYFNIDQKYEYVLKNYPSLDEKTYVAKPENGYEAMYLVANGKPTYFEWGLNANAMPEESDAEFLGEGAEVEAEEDEEAEEESGMTEMSDSELEEFFSANGGGGKAVPLWDWPSAIQKWITSLVTSISSTNCCGKQSKDFYDNLDSSANLPAEGYEGFGDEDKPAGFGKGFFPGIFFPDSDYDGIPDNRDVRPYNGDTNDNGVPDGAEATKVLKINSSVLVLEADSSDKLDLTVQALDISGKKVSQDSFTKVEVKIVEGEDFAKILSANPATLSEGEAVFTIYSTNKEGNFKIQVSAVNRDDVSDSNIEIIKTTKKRLKLIAYTKSIEKIEESRLERVFEGILIKDKDGNDIALLHGKTLRPEIKNPQYKVDALPASLDEYTRLVLRHEEESKNVEISFVPGDKVVTIDPSGVSYPEIFESLRGVHIKSLNSRARLERSENRVELFVSSKKVGFTKSDGKIFLNDDYSLQISRDGISAAPTTFEVVSKNGQKLFEMLIVVDASNVRMVYTVIPTDPAERGSGGISQSLSINSMRSLDFARDDKSFIPTAHAATNTYKVPDGDSDDLNDLEELILETNKSNPDTDADTFPDGEEIENGYDPKNKFQPLFKDLETVHEAFSAIIKLLRRGVLVGYQDKTIRPDKFITREEFIKVDFGAICINCTNLYDDIKKEVKNKYKNDSFPDENINPELYYCVAEGKNRGIISGYKGEPKAGYYLPKRNISRAEATKVILETAEIDIETGSLENRPWYYFYVSTAQKMHLYPKNRFDILDNATQADFQKWFDSQIADDGDFQKWLNDPITRAEFAMMVINLWELSDCIKNDKDSDFICDAAEHYEYGTNPSDPDTDKGGKSDFFEIVNKMDPLDRRDDGGDGDGDSMGDAYEDEYGLDTSRDDSQEDPDNDGLKNIEEFEKNTDPFDPDTDDGGVNDGDEVLKDETDPLDPLDDKKKIRRGEGDTDGDGLSDKDEVDTHDTDPDNPDTDGDGLSDGDEVNEYNTDPNDPDTDDGGVSDFDEVNNDNDPLDPEDDADLDRDKDGLLNDDEENNFGTDPDNADTDGGGVSDFDEVKEDFTDPLDPEDDGTSVKDTDGDSLTDDIEADLGTDPENEDTDGDGNSDFDEVLEGTDPLDENDPGDGIARGDDGGIYISGDITKEELYEEKEITEERIEEKIVYLNKIPADGETTVYLRAEIQNEFGEIIESDNSSTVEFIVESGEDFADILKMQVKAKKGIAETEIRSKITAGDFRSSAQIITEALPVHKANVYVHPLEPASLTILSQSDVIKIGGVSKTKVKIVLRDIHGNITNNKAYRVTLNISGPGSVDPSLDTDPEQEGIQIITLDGQIIFDLLSGDEEGDTKIEAQTGEIKAEKIVKVLKDIRLELSKEEGDIPADSGTVVTIRAEAQDSEGELLANFSGEISFELMDSLYGSLSDRSLLMENGIAEVTFIPSAVSGNTYISAISVGIEPGVLEITTLPLSTSKLALISENPHIPTEDEVIVKARLFDKNGNFAFIDSDTTVNFRLTDKTQKFAELEREGEGESDGPGVSGDLREAIMGIQVKAENGIAKIKVKTNKLTGPVNLVASSSGLGSSSLALQSVSVFDFEDVKGVNPDVLYASLLGAPVGDVTKDNYLGGWFLFSGKVQSVASLLTSAKQFKRLFSADSNGKYEVLDEMSISTYPLAANSPALPTRIVVKNVIANQTLAELFVVLQDGSLEILENDEDLLALNQGVFVKKSTDDERVTLKKSLFFGGGMRLGSGGRIRPRISILVDSQEVARVDNSGRVFISDPFYTLVENKDYPFMAFDLFEGNLPIATIIFKQDLNQNVTELEPDFDLNTASELEPGVYMRFLSDTPGLQTEEIFTGNSTNSLKGLAIINKEEEVLSAQSPKSSFISLDRALDERGVGFVGDNKHMLLIASGIPVGQAHLNYASEIGIILGDPTLSLGKPTHSSTGYTKDVGRALLTGSDIINDISTFDYNNDGREDVILGYEDGKVRLLQNTLSEKKLEDRGLLLNLANGIISMDKGDFDNDGYEDLVVATKDSCKKDEVCVDIYRNYQGKLTRENLPLEINNRVYMIRSGDLNNDGFTDIVTSDAVGTIKAFYNHGGTIDTVGDEIGNLGVKVDPDKNLKEEVLVFYSGMTTNRLDPADDIDFKKISVDVEGYSETLSEDFSSKVLDFVSENEEGIEVSMTEPENKQETEFTYLDHDQKLSRSVKKGIDLNGGIVEPEGIIKYTITLANSSSTDISNLYLSDIVPDSVELNFESIKCGDCSSEISIEETGLSMRPFVVKNIDIPANESRNISYEVKVKSVPKVSITLGYNFGDYTVDEYLDILATPENNPTGRSAYFYSDGIIPISEDDRIGKFIFFRKIKYTKDLSPLPEPPPNQDEDNDGIPDFLKETDENGVPVFVQNAFDDRTKTDNDGNGIPDNRESAPLDEIAGVVQGTINALKCSGGCIAMPLNYAFLAPGWVNIMGMPGGFDPGLPVFGWGIPNPFWPFWPGSPYQASAGRIYISPTLTGGLGVGLCLGAWSVNPSMQSATKCYVVAVPVLQALGVCDAINCGISEAMSAANSAISSASGAVAVNLGGTSGGSSTEASRSETGGMVSYGLGKYEVAASTSTNISIPGTPVWTDWAYKQLAEISKIATELPSFYVIYPSGWSMLESFVPKKNFTGFFDILTFLNSIPLVQIEAQDIILRVPVLTNDEIEKISLEWENWKDNFADELEDYEKTWDFIIGKSDRKEELKEKLDFVSKDGKKLISTIEQNMEILEAWKELPREIYKYRKIKAFYLKQIICYLDTLINYMGGYFKKNAARVFLWRDTIGRIVEAVKTWKLFTDIFVDYMEGCDECKSDRYTLMELILKLLIVVPSPPVIPFPKWPDVVLDFSQIQAGITLKWPEIKFKPEPIALPTIPRIVLPNLPDISIGAGFTLPQISLLPEPPAFPQFPGLSIPLPKLPDIPPPPEIPRLTASLSSTIKILKPIMLIYCLIKKAYLPIDESALKPEIEALTERGLEPLLPFDLSVKVQYPKVKVDFVDKIVVTAKTNLRMDTDFIVNIAKEAAKPWNELATWLTDFSKALQDLTTTEISIGEDVIPEDVDVDVKYEGNANIKAMSEELLAKDLMQKYPMLSPYVDKLNDELGQLQKVADEQKQKNEEYPEKILLVAESEELTSDDPRLNRDIAEIKQNLGDYPVSDSSPFGRLVGLRNKMIDYYESSQDFDLKLENLQDEDLEHFYRILVKAENSSPYVLANNDSNLLYSTGTVEEVVTKLEDGLDENEVETQDLASLPTGTNKLLAQVPDDQGTSSMVGPKNINKGIFIYNKDTEINEKLINNTADLNLPSKMRFFDLDNDNDEDFIYSVGGNLYIKENHQETSGKVHYRRTVDVVDLADIVPQKPSINGFKLTDMNNKKVTVAWTKGENVTGYELDYFESLSDLVKSENLFGLTRILLLPPKENLNIELVSLQDQMEIEVTEGRLTLKNTRGDITFTGTERKKVSGESEIKIGDIIHTLEESEIKFRSDKGDETTVSLAKNRLFTISDVYQGKLEIDVRSGEVEIIDPGSETTEIEAYDGMLLDFESKVSLSDRSSATVIPSSDISSERVLSLSNLKAALIDRSNHDFASNAIELKENEKFIIKELANPENPSLKLEIPNGNYYSKVYALTNDLKKGASSDTVLLSPQSCADKQDPIASIGKMERSVSVFKTVTVDGSSSFDTGSEIIEYAWDTDLNTDSDDDGDKENDRNQFGEKITLGPFEDLETRKVKLTITDESLNSALAEAIINVFAPDVSLNSALAKGGIIEGYLDPPESEIPVVIARKRGNSWNFLHTPSASENHKYFSDEKGAFRISDLDLESHLTVLNQDGEEIAEIDQESGRIIVKNDNYMTEVVSASYPLPTRIVLKDKETSQGLVSVFFIPDANTDVSVDSPDTDYSSENVSGFKGVHTKDTDPEDEFIFQNISGDSPAYPGGVEVHRIRRVSQVMRDTVAPTIPVATIDTDGSIYLHDKNVSITLKEAVDSFSPAIFEVRYKGRLIGEVYIAVKKEKDPVVISGGSSAFGITESKVVKPKKRKRPILISTVDSDSDSMPDLYETAYGLNPNDPADALLDPDNDGLINKDEYRARTNPENKDTDSDTYNDKEEIEKGYDPLHPLLSPFSDVLIKDPIFNQIMGLVDKGILEGYKQGDLTALFKADRDISRAEFAKIILLALCIIPSQEAKSSPEVFSDIPYTDNLPWYYDYTKEAYLQNLITGYKGEKDASGLTPFKPNNTITRAEATKIILEALEKLKIIGIIKARLEEGEPWYTSYIEAAKDLNPYLIEKGGTNNFLLTEEEAKYPNKNVTRGEFVIMASRVFNFYDCFGLDFDDDGIPTYWEEIYGLNPYDAIDADLDPDKDGLINRDEYKYRTDPFDADTDDGGISDGNEVRRGSLPLDPRDESQDNDDPDFDGLKNSEEDKYGTNPLRGDTDGGGRFDKDEILSDTDPTANPWDDKEDSDFDGLSDEDEVKIYGTNPYNPDTDGGGVSEGIEVYSGTDPLNGDDDPDAYSSDDPDGDGLISDIEKDIYGTDPYNPDTDGGGVWDGVEVGLGADPLDKEDDADLDVDGDGLTNNEEKKYGTDPFNPDTDGGGVWDGNEVNLGMDPFDSQDDKKGGLDQDNDGLTEEQEREIGTDPTIYDTDGDGFSDGTEVDEKTDPLDVDEYPKDVSDRDGDGLLDDQEPKYGTDPDDPDTDDGGVLDGKEVSAGTDPLDPDDDTESLIEGEDEGLYIVETECNTCPCPATVVNSADLMPGDVIFGSIMDKRNMEIYSKSNEVEYVGE